MDRLHEKGLISDPVGKAKSVVFSEEGLRRSEHDQPGLDLGHDVDPPHRRACRTIARPNDLRRLDDLTDVLWQRPQAAPTLLITSERRMPATWREANAGQKSHANRFSKIGRSPPLKAPRNVRSARRLRFTGSETDLK
jgi:hypothetical protein